MHSFTPQVDWFWSLYRQVSCWTCAPSCCSFVSLSSSARRAASSSKSIPPIAPRMPVGCHTTTNEPWSELRSVRIHLGLLFLERGRGDEGGGEGGGGGGGEGRQALIRRETSQKTQVVVKSCQCLLLILKDIARQFETTGLIHKQFATCRALVLASRTPWI